ncbi:hypothetical protein SAMN04487962_1236 [Marinobacter segnicrescens]|uniref:PcRGLX/YetA-like N-terminal RIFT barrel domain-containing protein n=1 Tax=Marinobacter segnicrescens TaxID=430453 RepID=A0A1I0H141_9GAMM|nr:hypothetical protein [Marinobacter segnicrescens]SET77415.1 hypothetical protein SAMN04487962_1236 [Marinobacter segnicrescens]
MEAIRIYLKDEQGVKRKGEVFQLGIPLARGQLSHGTSFALMAPDSLDELVCQTSTMASWSDGSTRWLKLQFLCDLEPGAQRTLELRPRETPFPPTSLLSAERGYKGLVVDTGAARFHLTANAPAWVCTGSNAPIHHQLTLSTEANTSCQTRADKDWEIIEHGLVSLSCQQEGWFLDGDIRLARYHCRLTFYCNSKTVEVQACLHNPKRALHPGGLWDLGDPGSIHFRSLTIDAELANIQQLRITPEPGMPAVELDSRHGMLYQDSSGGEHWDSLNHVNAKGEITTRFRGYRLYIGDHIQIMGDRANPVIVAANQTTTIQATLPQFWQNFPSTVGFQDNRLIIGLFPGEAAEAYELQGGERKTQTAYFHYGDDPDGLAWTLTPAIPVLDARQYEEGQAFPWFASEVPRSPVDDLVQLGLCGPSNFFTKRELIDEYGWRNFGDIFADHESLYQGKEEPALISHYNNQYDAIYGFARQFALSGDPRWHHLMNDLAAHVRDIDIYHTEEDRTEYNNGLFWHTDHYLPAHTATHRTFSRFNDTSSTVGQTGGGPAEEHCYTTGLLYHYLLTGDSRSKEAVLQMARWITSLHEGSGSLIEALIKIKRHDLSRIKRLLLGKPVNVHRYPFNRGTGNYLNTLLDAHLIDPTGEWLAQSEKIIFETIHPKDNLKSRDLLATETRWSYLVFLSSLSRFLWIKAEEHSLDGSYRYALDSFRRYTRWMAEFERPYLTDPDQLEYPNHTWTAQDIRKSMLLYQAAILDPEYRDLYLAKARFFENHVVETLSHAGERHFARVQIILLQNYGPQTLPKESNVSWLKEAPIELNYHAKNLTVAKVAKHACGRLIRALIRFNPVREKAWLETRLPPRRSL